MRILILGGDGMMGHRLFKQLQSDHTVKVTLRLPLTAYAELGLFGDGNAFGNVDARTPDRLLEAAGDFRPDAIVNCVGIVKQRDEAKAFLPSLEINALLPHRLALIARAVGARLIHLSTDCVFSGARGGYREEDVADATDLYGRTKLLGEIYDPPCLTLRTSIIGPELSRKGGLLEWFLAQRGKQIKGFSRAIFSGLTTFELSRALQMLLERHPRAVGLYHVSSTPISKYDLLCRIRAALHLDVSIDEDPALHCDRSLDSTRFRTAFGYDPPSWDVMVAELARELR